MFCLFFSCRHKSGPLDALSVSNVGIRRYRNVLFIEHVRYASRWTEDHRFRGRALIGRIMYVYLLYAFVRVFVCVCVCARVYVRAYARVYVSVSVGMPEVCFASAMLPKLISSRTSCYDS